jgi:AraC-like DNA-binding protein
MRFSIYVMPRPAVSVSLYAPHLVVCGVISGRTRFQVGRADASVEVVAGESVVISPGQQVHIDVPKAQLAAPTTCGTLEIERATVQRIVDRLIETTPLASVPGRGETRDPPLYVAHSSALERVLRALVELCLENPPYRDALIDVNATELVLRMLQTEARALLLGRHPERASARGVAAAIQYVHDHLDRHLSVRELADAACMSRSTFYRKFRDEVGVTPLQYVYQQRMNRARTLLQDADQTVTDVSLALGFRSVSHFITRFKQSVGLTPKVYQERVQREL